MAVMAKADFHKRLTQEEISKVLELSEREPMFYVLVKTYELCDTVNTQYIPEILRVLEAFGVLPPGRDKELMG